MLSRILSPAFAFIILFSSHLTADQDRVVIKDLGLMTLTSSPHQPVVIDENLITEKEMWLAPWVKLNLRLTNNSQFPLTLQGLDFYVHSDSDMKIFESPFGYQETIAPGESIPYEQILFALPENKTAPSSHIYQIEVRVFGWLGPAHLPMDRFEWVQSIYTK